jgi:glutamyl endopeptidase
MRSSTRRWLVLGSVTATVAALLATGAPGATAAPAAPAAPAVSPDTPTVSAGPAPVAARTGAAGSSRPSYAGTGKVPAPGAKAPAGRRMDAAPESIWGGTDDRIRITPTTSFPASATVMITRNGSAHCSGWMISANTVATAGHCVHTGGSGGTWYTGLAAWPGRDGASAPYGSCSVRQSYSVVGWTTNGNEAYDYGALKLNCTVGNSTGWYGFWWQAASLAGYSTLINGYPGEKPFGEQWRGDSVARTVAVAQAEQVFYSNDTTGGMSGSPVYQNRAGCGFCSMAIHAYGFPHGGFPHNSYNHGTRITQAKFNNLVAWKDAP